MVELQNVCCSLCPQVTAGINQCIILVQKSSCEKWSLFKNKHIRSMCYTILECKAS